MKIKAWLEKWFNSRYYVKYQRIKLRLRLALQGYSLTKAKKVSKYTYYSCLSEKIDLHYYSLDSHLNGLQTYGVVSVSHPDLTTLTEYLWDVIRVLDSGSPVNPFTGVRKDEDLIKYLSTNNGVYKDISTTIRNYVAVAEQWYTLLDSLSHSDRLIDTRNLRVLTDLIEETNYITRELVYFPIS